MNLTITRENLQKGLTSATAPIPSSSSLPVLSNVLIETDGDSLWLTGSDLDLTVRVKVPAEVEEAGRIAAPGQKLQELSRELPNEPVSLRARGDQVEIDCGYSRFQLHGMPADEFPSPPGVDFESGWTVPAEALERLIRSTSFSVATEESRPTLNGVLWELREETMGMIATNGHRLAKMEIPVGSAGGAGGDLVVPPMALDQVRKLFSDQGEVTVAQSGRQLGFSSASVEVYTRLIDGTYPNYRQVIPTDNENVALVDREVLEPALRRMAVIADSGTRKVKMTFADDKLSLHVQTPDLGEAHDEVQLDYQGESLEIGFNANYLLDVLKHMPSDEVKFAFKTAERAATVVPADDSLDYVCLVMPLRLVS